MAKRIPKRKNAARLSAVEKSPADSIWSEGAVDATTLAREVGCSQALIRKAMDDGRLSFSRIGRKRLLPRKAVREYLDRNLVPARDRKGDAA